MCFVLLNSKRGWYLTYQDLAEVRPLRRIGARRPLTFDSNKRTCAFIFFSKEIQASALLLKDCSFNNI